MEDFFGYLQRQWGIVKLLDEEDSSVETYNQLVKFVESCNFSTDSVDKFVCENWRMSVSELIQLGSHKGIEKQVIADSYSKVNKMYGSIFSFLTWMDFQEADEIEYDDEYYIAFEKLHVVLNYDFSKSEIFAKDIYPNWVLNFGVFKESLYIDIAETNLDTELEFLKKLSNESSQKDLNSCDPYILGWIFKTLNQKIMGVDGININKLYLLSCLNL